MGFATTRALALLRLSMLYFAIYNIEARLESILPTPHDDGSNDQFHLPPFPSVPIQFPPFPSVPIQLPPFPSVPIQFPPFPSVPIQLPPFPSAPIQLPPFPSVQVQLPIISHGPPLPPFSFPKSFLAVQGVVYCKLCKHFNNNMFLGSFHLSGAGIKLQCNHTFTKVTQEVKGETDEFGYFRINAPKDVTSFEAHKCKVFLVSAPPKSTCTEPSNLHGGIEGASLRPIHHIGHTGKKDVTVLYNVGPLAFQPLKC